MRKMNQQTIYIYNDVKSGKIKYRVAKEYGVSKQRVDQIVKRLDNKEFVPAYIYHIHYPKIREWARKQNIGFMELTEKMSNNEVKPNTIYRFLQGKSGGNIKVIQAVLSATGMTFEEAFGDYNGSY